MNTRERPTLNEALERELKPLTVSETLSLVDHEAQLLDTRPATEFEGAHVRGALNVGLGGSFATWCGTVLDRERPVVLIAEPGREVEAATRLGRIGFDMVAGYLDGGMQAVDGRPDLVERIERVTAGSACELLASASPPALIDVRSVREFGEGHIDGALNLPLSQLGERLADVPDRALLVYCAGGYRSSLAVSMLRRAGVADVSNLVGGLGAWESAELPTVA